MPEQTSLKRIPRLTAAIGIGTAALLYASTCLAQSTAPHPAPLREPPKLNYQKTCSPPTALQPLAADWSKWNGEENGVGADRMLADAARLTDGDTEVHRDRVLARKMLETIASSTSTSAPDAKARLALLMLDPRSGPTNPEQASRLLVEATAAQRTGAALSMGKLIREGKLPGMALSDGSRYLSIAAGLGDPVAALQLAALYGKPGAAQPFPDAASHFATLAAIGVQTALASGNCAIAADVGDYLSEMDPQQGPALSVRWYELGVMAGDVRAMTRLARAYETGEGKDRDLAKAGALWDQAAAAGSARAMTQAARLRLTAGGDTAAAVTLLNGAMANGEADAFLLAARHFRGDYTGKSDFAAMLSVLEAAVRQPDASVVSIEMLANAYMTGQGVAVDKERADALYQSLLTRDDPDGEGLFGRYLINNGLGLSAGIEHLHNAARKGSQMAQFQLAQTAYCMADNAEPLLQQAARDGSTPALRRLARMAMDRGDKAAATTYWWGGVALGDRLAMVDLASAASAGAAMPAVNPTDLIKRAAAPGDGMIDGRLALSVAYRTGKLPDATGEGDRLMASLANSGRADVEVEAARRNMAVTPNDGAAWVERLTKAADSGDTDAMYLLSRLSAAALPQGSSARDWLIRAAAMGNSDALAELPSDDPAVADRVLASLKDRLLCDVPSLVGAARLHRLRGPMEAANAEFDRAERLADGRPRDLYLLAQVLVPKTAGVPSDPAKAAVLFERSASVGYVKSALALADLYAGGALGPHDPDAIDWYSKAAIGGEASGVRELVKYASQPARQEIADKALAALQRVAENDDAAAMQAYGSVLATLGPERYAEGMTFLEKAAGKGDVQAMKTLARLYAAGLNGTVSAEESTRWTRQAAEKGDPEAMFQYAIALDLGFGVTIDRNQAQSWQEKAKENGFLR